MNESPFTPGPTVMMGRRMCDFFTTILVAGILYSGCLEPAEAQWQVPLNATPQGRGSGVTGFKSLAEGNPTFNVANYASLTAAVTAARAAGNGTTVFLPCGTYALGAGATGLSVTGSSALRITGPSGINGGAGQCATITYTGTGTMIDADLAYGLEIDHIVLSASGAGAKIFKLSNTFAPNIHDNMIINSTSNANNIGIDLELTQGAVIERNAISVAGGIGIRGVAPAGSFSVKVKISKNTFFSASDIAISSPGQAWTISDNIAQNPVTGFIRPGPANTCDVLNIISNDIDDVTANKTLIQSNCKSLVSISNRYTGSGTNKGILQDNSTGAVTSINDRFDGATGVDIGTGNYLFLTRAQQVIPPTNVYIGTPANTDVVQTKGGAAVITGKLSLGLSGTYAGSLRFWNTTAGANSVTVAPPAGAIGLVSLGLPNTSDTLIGRATTDTLTNKTISGASNTFSNISTNTILALGTGGICAVVPQNATSYFGVWGCWSTTEANWETPASIAFTARNLRVFVTSTPAAGQTYIMTLRKNTADTSVTCTISNPATTCSDLSNTVAFAAGDLISMKVVASATAGNVTAINTSITAITTSP